MTPRAEARLLGRAIRRFNTSAEQLDDAIETLYRFMMNEELKPSTRIDSAKALIAAEALNQKDEHKLIGLMGPDATAEQSRNRFLEPDERIGSNSVAGSVPAS